MYDATADPYCYPGTNVLVNLLNIRDAAELERLESDIAKQRADEPLPRGRLSVSHYYSIHRHLFGDIYRWAGQPRTVRISKGDSMFCYPEHISHQMRVVFQELRSSNFFHGPSAEHYAIRAARFLSMLNAIHPFRDGNGRTQLSFLKLLTLTVGHRFVAENLHAATFLQAMISSFSGDERPLAAEIRRLID